MQSRRFFFYRATPTVDDGKKNRTFRANGSHLALAFSPFAPLIDPDRHKKPYPGVEREREMVQGRKERARRAFSLSTTSTVVRFRLPTLSLSLSRARALDSTRSLALSLSRSHPTSALERFHSHLHRETENKEEGGREKTRPRTETLNALEKRESERR